MPLLRRHDADHRDIQTRASSPIPRATKQTGSMINCLIIASNTNRLLQRHRPKSLARSDPGRHVKGANRKRRRSLPRHLCLPDVKTAALNLTNYASTATSKPNPQRFLPIDTAQPPRLPPREIFQRGLQSGQAERVHPGLHQKIFIELAFVSCW
jgi:hypothetical protein